MFAKRRPPVDHLRDLGPFIACSRPELERIARVSDVVDVEAGHVLTVAGRTGQECFVVVDGEATVIIGGREVACVGRGSLIGEMSLIDRRPRSATVVALTPMRVVVFSRPAFAAVVADAPLVASNVLAMVTMRLRAAQKALV